MAIEKTGEYGQRIRRSPRHLFPYHCNYPTNGCVLIRKLGCGGGSRQTVAGGEHALQRRPVLSTTLLLSFCNWMLRFRFGFDMRIMSLTIM